MSITDHGIIALTCSNCGHQAEKALGWVRGNSRFTCAGCQQAVEFDGEAIVEKVSRQIERARAHLYRAVQRINRRLKSG